MIDDRTRPACPYPCAGSGCPHIRTDAECIACEARPALDAHYRALDAWREAQERDYDARERDRTGSSPYHGPAAAGWGRQD